ncbi:MAG: pYEATS domain-containing protein [Pyrinomonadaceae bacterium]
MQGQFQILTELVRGVPPKQFTEGGRYYYYVRIYLEGLPSALETIDLVKYMLHPTFKVRTRISDDREHQFEIKIWTYGYFDTTATIVFRDGTTQAVRGYVEWQIPAGLAFDDE